MLIIDYTPFDFPEKFGPNLAKPNELRCAWSDLVWAGLTVGRRSLRQVIQPETYAYFELVYRSTLLYANLQAADYRLGLWGPIDTHIQQSVIYRDLDPLEKSAVSYFVGLTATKLFAEKLLDLPWLSHLDTYSHGLDPASASPPVYPDLVGLDGALNWVVVEAKGRSNWLNKRILKRLKTGVQALATIDGQAPSLRLGVASYFSGQNRRLKVYLQDPPDAPDMPEKPTLAFSVADYLAAYYRLFFEALTAQYGDESRLETYNGRVFRIKEIYEADLRIGLAEAIYQQLSAKKKLSPNYFSDVAAKVKPAQKTDNQTITVGRDGVYVETGQRWRAEKMHQPPAERY